VVVFPTEVPKLPHGRLPTDAVVPIRSPFTR